MGTRYLNSIFNDSVVAEEKFSTGKLMDHLCRIISTVISIVFLLFQINQLQMTSWLAWAVKS